MTDAAHSASVTSSAGLVCDWGRGLRFREDVHDLVVELPVPQRLVELVASHSLVFPTGTKQELASQLGVSFRRDRGIKIYSIGVPHDILVLPSKV